MKLGTSIRARATNLLTTLESEWKYAFSPNRNRPPAGPAFLGADLEKNDVSGEFHTLIGVLGDGRRRILAGNFLRVWIGWWCCVLIALIVAAAFLAKLAGALIAAAMLVGVGALGAYIWARRTRPSLYHAACRLDAAAGLHDRMSTALCFGNSANPDRMVLRQRQDALRRVSRVDVSTLFPIRMPAIARRALVLAVIAGGMLLYRVYYRAPITALLQASARSRLLQAALANTEIARDQRAPDSTPQDFWKKTAAANDDSQSDFQGEPSTNAPDTPEKGQSLAESLAQALKKLTSNESGQQSTSTGANQPQSSRKDSTQMKNSSQGNPSDGGTPDDSQSQSDGQHISPGAGDKLRDPQPVGKNTLNSTDPSVKAVPDRVALPSANLKDQPRTQASTETGAAQLAVHDISPRAMAVINGAEQDDIPARYRLYVQRYFQHDDDKTKDNSTQAGADANNGR